MRLPEAGAQLSENWDPSATMRFPDNFPDESLYFMAKARLSVGGAGAIGRARVIVALEATFWHGILQADAYSGYRRLYAARALAAL